MVHWLNVIKIANNIDPNHGFLYNQVDLIMEHFNRRERLFSFDYYKVNMGMLTPDFIANLIAYMVNLFLENNSALMLVLFRSNSSGHYTIIQKKWNQIRIIEPQPSMSCGIPKTVYDYLHDERFAYYISNIGFFNTSKTSSFI